MEIIRYSGNKDKDKILREFCLPINKINEETKNISDKMIELMIKENGIGLAANQVGLSIQMFVMFIKDEMIEPEVFINPKIISRLGHILNEEGCLSLPGISRKINRSKIIYLEYQNLKGEKLKKKLIKLMSICCQHEMDHLQGKILLDY